MRCAGGSGGSAWRAASGAVLTLWLLVAVWHQSSPPARLHVHASHSAPSPVLPALGGAAPPSASAATPSPAPTFALVTGAGRSGTLTLAALLSIRCGVNMPHEALGAHGSVSWPYAAWNPLLAPWAWAPTAAVHARAPAWLRKRWPHGTGADEGTSVLGLPPWIPSGHAFAGEGLSAALAGAGPSWAAPALVALRWRVAAWQRARVAGVAAASALTAREVARTLRNLTEHAAALFPSFARDPRSYGAGRVFADEAGAVFARVVHVVRHPLRVVTSLANCFCGSGDRSDPVMMGYDAKSFAFAAQFVPLPPYTPDADAPARRCAAAAYWVHWNAMAEVQATARVRLEEVLTAPGVALPLLVRDLGLEHATCAAPRDADRARAFAKASAGRRALAARVHAHKSRTVQATLTWCAIREACAATPRDDPLGPDWTLVPLALEAQAARYGYVVDLALTDEAAEGLRDADAVDRLWLGLDAVQAGV